ncbi:MAG: LysR family transcriptional regulator [Eubacterium sp.]|nr:LysR family transcriptional regulator [Eubacterium sp.]
MTLQQLHYVLVIAKVGSLNKAAERLYVTQPSLTGAVHELEKEIGIRIFHRSNRGMTVTPEGTEFLAHARQLYEQYELLLQRYDDSKKRKKKFSVSTQHYTFAVKAFANTVRHFDSLLFDFSILETKTRQVIEDVAQLRSEIGILYMSHYNKKVIAKLLKEKDLEFHPLIDSRAYVYLRKGHPLAKEPSISIRQLEPYPCLFFEQGGESSAYYAEEILTELEYPRRIKTNDRASMINLMIGLDGYTLCSGVVSGELNGDDFVTVPFQEEVEYLNQKMTIGYIVKKRSVRSEVGAIYLEELKKLLDGLIDDKNGK